MNNYVLAFGASSSIASINVQLVRYVVGLMPSVESYIIDLNDFEMPIYSTDRESSAGIHPRAKAFKKLIVDSTGILISLAEHNGSYTTAFKNIIDWTSRIEGKLWSGKPMMLLSTAPGARGGATVLDSAKTYFPFMGAQIVDSMTLPKFHQNFSNEDGIIDLELKAALFQRIEKFKEIISS